MVKEIEYQNQIYNVEMFVNGQSTKHGYDRGGDPSFGGKHGINVYRNPDNLITSIVFEHQGGEFGPFSVLVDKALFQVHPAVGIEFYRVNDELACIIDTMPI